MAAINKAWLPSGRGRAVLLAAVLGSIALLPAKPTSVRAASECENIVPNTGEWLVELCRSDQSVSTTMAVSVNGVSKGRAVLVRVVHKSNGQGYPQVGVIYSSGYVRLKQNADPDPAIPFGASAVLGPALWPSLTEYWHNPTLSWMDISTTALPSALVFRAVGTNHDLDVLYRITMLTPTDSRTSLLVDQVTRARKDILIDTVRAAEGQGAKTAAQISTMHIPTRAPCNGGIKECHDVDSVRFIDGNGNLKSVFLDEIPRPGFILPAPTPLGGKWVDARHSDDTSWQGDPPSIRICMDALPAGRDLRVQGFVAATSDPNDDNVGLWISDQWRASMGWRAGESEALRYRIIAQNDFSGLEPGAC